MHVSTASFEYANEIAELRQLGFAEGLRLGDLIPLPHPCVARMESGRHGLAVEFLGAHDSGCYALLPLHVEERLGARVSSIWSEVVAEVRRRAPVSDDD
jgi:hypothetical protein